jgi:CHAT domain-containing protein
MEIRLLEIPALAGGAEKSIEASTARNVFDAGEESSIGDLFENARWDFRADGTFSFDPGLVKGALPDLFPLEGSWQRQGEVFEIRAARENPIGLTATLDGVIRRTGRGRQLDAVFFQSMFFLSRRLASVHQRLRSGEPFGTARASGQQIGGIPLPSVFQISVEGSVDGRSIAGIPGLLSMRPAKKGLSYPVVVELLTLTLMEDGTMQWDEPPPWADPERYRVTVEQGRLTIEAEAPTGKQQVGHWMSPAHFQDLEIPLLILGDRGRLELRVSGDQVVGEVQIFKTAGSQAGYRGTFSGRRWRGATPLLPPSSLSASLRRIYGGGSVGETIAEGVWGLEDGSGAAAGSLSLRAGEQLTFYGELATEGGTSRLEGHRQGRRIDLMENGPRKERWLLRVIPGSNLLVGMVRAEREERSRPVVARRIQTESSTPAASVETGDSSRQDEEQRALERAFLGISAAMTGRCREARPLLEEMIERSIRYSSSLREIRSLIDFSPFLLVPGLLATEMLANCAALDGDYQAFLSHLQTSAQVLLPLREAERQAFLTRAQEDQAVLPLLEAFLDGVRARFSDACWRRRFEPRDSMGASMAGEIAAAGAGLESLRLAFREHNDAVREILQAVSERRLSYSQGSILLNQYRGELRDRVRFAFAQLAIAGRELLGKRDPVLLAQRDEFWERLTDPDPVQGLNPASSFFHLMQVSLSFRFSSGLTVSERDLVSEQFIAGSLLLVIDAVLIDDEARSTLAPMIGLGTDVVQIASDLASRPELWRSRLRTDAGKIQSLDRLQPFFSDLILFLLEEEREGEALAVSEIARSRALLDLLVDKERLRKGLEAFWQRAGDSSLPSPAAVSPPTLDHVLDVVQWRRVPTVEYFLTNDRLVIFSIAPDRSVSAVSSPVDRKALGASIEELRRLLAGRGEADAGRTHELLRELYRLLIAPIPAERLPASPEAVLTIIPHQELFGVPFAALEDEAGRPLIERFALAHGTSITTLGLMRQNRKERPPGQPPRLLALVDPAPLPKTPAGQTLAPLSSIAAQFGSIANFYAEKDRLVLTGPRATEAALLAKAADADVLQLVTHAELVEDDPLSSYIALAAGRGSADGYLRVPEIFRLSVPADLVILWACETGRGGISADGIEGLSRGFIWAGATSLILSLWEIPEDESFIQMYGFHDFWLRQGLPKARALQQAQVEYSRLYPDQPGLWAGLVLYGEAD